ncbi:hypothetical protein BS47DRAFT_1387458 [Hydnum rufescens UP504]|uniref:G domain-containing protein n=1 Tax=Hydnum rufescens UP504 TaxID=1448309 RepID=A0A9P6BAG7_9AGAM|nr:hypothetical protein BS47DRAFT_1387458 [Hydnum rufescens UP504]
MWKSIRKHFQLPNKLINKPTKKEHPDEESPDEQQPDEQQPDEQHSDEERSDEEWSSEGHSDEGHSDEELSDEESSVKRFRVLILGPANAGKTTLLERLTDSPAGAAIVTRNGKLVKQDPKGHDQRGIHIIDDEITYASDPAFVFHDSGGFEAGGVEEVEAVWKFIRKRSLASPSQQLHAIWLCIPTDNDRPFEFLQLGFFSESTASVPVIGIFTKLDGRRTKVEVEVLGPSPSPPDFLNCGQEVEWKVAEFINRLEMRFQKQKYPPAGFIRVGSMHTLSTK